LKKILGEKKYLHSVQVKKQREKNTENVGGGGPYCIISLAKRQKYHTMEVSSYPEKAK